MTKQIHIKLNEKIPTFIVKVAFLKDIDYKIGENLMVNRKQYAILKKNKIDFKII